MMQKIINEVVKAYAGGASFDEVKRGIKLAMAMSGLEWTAEEYANILDAVVTRLLEVE